MIRRCAWAEKTEIEKQYHDQEWGVPERNPRKLWECLMLEGFQAGLSWVTILRKREAFRVSFAGFDPEKVARFTDADVGRLVADPGIVRSRAKIEATIGGARAYLTMREQGVDFADYCWGLVGGAPVMGDGVSVHAQTPLSVAASKALKAKGFKFVGPTIVYAWMQATGLVNDHAVHCFRRNA